MIHDSVLYKLHCIAITIVTRSQVGVVCCSHCASWKLKNNRKLFGFNLSQTVEITESYCARWDCSYGYTCRTALHGFSLRAFFNCYVQDNYWDRTQDGLFEAQRDSAFYKCVGIKKAQIFLGKLVSVNPLGAEKLNWIVPAYCMSITYKRLFTGLKIERT